MSVSQSNTDIPLVVFLSLLVRFLKKPNRSNGLFESFESLPANAPSVSPPDCMT